MIKKIKNYYINKKSDKLHLNCPIVIYPHNPIYNEIRLGIFNRTDKIIEHVVCTTDEDYNRIVIDELYPYCYHEFLFLNRIEEDGRRYISIPGISRILAYDGRSITFKLSLSSSCYRRLDYELKLVFGDTIKYSIKEALIYD